jgi:hypothetical protein
MHNEALMRTINIEDFDPEEVQFTEPINTRHFLYREEAIKHHPNLCSLVDKLPRGQSMDVCWALLVDGEDIELKFPISESIGGVREVDSPMMGHSYRALTTEGLDKIEILKGRIIEHFRASCKAKGFSFREETRFMTKPWKYPKTGEELLALSDREKPRVTKNNPSATFEDAKFAYVALVITYSTSRGVGLSLKLLAFD